MALLISSASMVPLPSVSNRLNISLNCSSSSLSIVYDTFSFMLSPFWTFFPLLFLFINFILYLEYTLKTPLRPCPPCRRSSTSIPLAWGPSWSCQPQLCCPSCRQWSSSCGGSPAPSFLSGDRCHRGPRVPDRSWLFKISCLCPIVPWSFQLHH